jgi:protein-S-isoprenylcysteine O-methyltransferase Ste14
MSETENTRRQAAGDPAEERAVDRDDSREQEPPRLFACLASLATVLLLMAGLFLERGDHATLRGAGVVVLALSGAFIFAPFLLLSRHGRNQGGKTYMQTGAVVDRGVYAITRHPQYLGYMLLACGFALLSQHWLALLLAAVSVSLFYLQAVGEEKYCRAQFGDSYDHYLRRVPRFNVVLGLIRLVRRNGIPWR